MQLVMVFGAEQHPVVDVGLTAVGELFHMVGVAPIRWCVTSIPDASAVYCGKRQPLLTAEESLGAAQVEHFTV